MATTFKLVVLCSLTIFLFAETCLKNKELLTGERWKQITVDSVLERVPYLRDNMQPIQMARLIDNMSLYLRQELAMIVYTVIDGKTRKVDCFSRQCPWFRDGKMMRDFVDQLAEELFIKDLYFVVYNRDEIHFATVQGTMLGYDPKHPQQPNQTTTYLKAYDHACELVLQLPAFRMSIDLGDGLLEHNHFLIPDSYMLEGFQTIIKSVREAGSWEANRQAARTASRNNPWELKTSKVFWRGIDSGKVYDIPLNQIRANISKYFPRMELARLSAQYPDKIDAKLTHRDQTYGWNEYFKAIGIDNQFVDGWASIADHVKFKYLISLDGWTAAWMRVPWIMATNSLLIKQETLKVEWFDYALKPYVHYYPVKRDLSNLLEVIDYLEKHQEEAQEIIRNANKFVEEFFDRDTITEAAKRVFRDYARVQNYTFTPVERELILQFNLSYHSFAQEPLERKDLLLQRLRSERRYGQFKQIILLSLAAAAVLLCVVKFKWIKRVCQRFCLRYTSPQLIQVGDTNSALESNRTRPDL